MTHTNHTNRLHTRKGGSFEMSPVQSTLTASTLGQVAPSTSDPYKYYQLHTRKTIRTSRAPDFPTRSEPARSTRCTVATRTDRALGSSNKLCSAGLESYCREGLLALVGNPSSLALLLPINDRPGASSESRSSSAMGSRSIEAACFNTVLATRHADTHLSTAGCN